MFGLYNSSALPMLLVIDVDSVPNFWQLRKMSATPVPGGLLSLSVIAQRSAHIISSMVAPAGPRVKVWSLESVTKTKSTANKALTC